MSATVLFTYVWHYLIARVLYDDVLRPLFGGRPLGLLIPAALGAGVFALLRGPLR